MSRADVWRIWGKRHAAEICANVASVLACQSPAGDKILSGEEEAFMCKTSGKISSVPVHSGGGLGNKDCALDWQVGDKSVICDDGASCHISYSSTGMINYCEAKMFMKTAGDTNTQSKVMEVLL